MGSTPVKQATTVGHRGERLPCGRCSGHTGNRPACLRRRARRDDRRSRHDRCSRGGLLVDRSRRQCLRRIGQRGHVGGLRSRCFRHLRVGGRHVGRRRGDGRLRGFRCGRCRGDRRRLGGLRIGCRGGHRGFSRGRATTAAAGVVSAAGAAAACAALSGAPASAPAPCRRRLHGSGPCRRPSVQVQGPCRPPPVRVPAPCRPPPVQVQGLVGDRRHAGCLRVGDRCGRRLRCLVRDCRCGDHGGSGHGSHRSRRDDRRCRCGGHRRCCGCGRRRGCNGGS